ncbi:MAG: hypothetical protein MUF60_06935, partial [Vicinamibacterales bacterium]|nr:hypothetical protein [Vicinamibacterales bacterium]
ILAGGALPWLPYAMPTLRRLGQNTPLRPAVLLGWTWLVVDVAFLSLAGSKLLTYLLPAFPAVALLAASAWSTALDADEASGERRPRWRAWHVAALLPMVVALPLAVAVVTRQLGLEVGGLVWGAIGSASVCWIAALGVALTRPLAAALTATAASLVVTLLTALVVLLPSLAPAFTARDLARHYNRVGALR